MPERSSKSQRLQFGLESAYDGGATVTRKLLSLMAEFDPQATRKRNYAQGYNFPSSTSFEKDWTDMDLSGALMFDEVIVPLTLAYGAVTPTNLTPATAKQWVWDIPLQGDIIPKSAKFEKGDASTGESVTGVVAVDLGFTWNRDEIGISGALIGTKMNEGATMTSSGVTTFPQVPMNPNGVGIFLDTTSAGLGTTRMVRAFEGGVSMSGMQGPIWPLNELKQSFDGIVSLRPDSESTVTVMADAAGKALLTSLRAGDRRFMRTWIKGPQIGAGPATYLFQVDQAVEIVDVASMGDDDGIYVMPLTFAPMADETWGKASVITVVNTTASI